VEKCCHGGPNQKGGGGWGGDNGGAKNIVANFAVIAIEGLH